MPNIKNMKRIGKRTIEVMEYGSGGYRKKNIRRSVYREPTLTSGVFTYWFQLWRGRWTNTTKKGIKDGIVVSELEFERIR